MSNIPRAPKVKSGSAFSRLRRGLRGTKENITNFFGNKTRTKTQKLKNIGKKIGSKYEKAFFNTAKYAVGPKLANNNTSHRPVAKRVAAGTAAALLGIGAATAGLGALGVGITTGTLGAITRGVAPVAGAATGAALGITKGAIEAAPRMVYGVGKALYHSPKAAIRGIKYSLAKKAFQRRTGFSNQTQSKIELLEAKKSKAETNLEELIQKQEKKLEGINAADQSTVERKIAKYTTQREKLKAKIDKREAKLQRKTRKALNKMRTSKAKRGETTQFTLNTARRVQLDANQRAKRFGVLRKSGETKDDFRRRLTFENGIDSVKDFSKRTGIKMFKGETEDEYKSRIGAKEEETHEAYHARVKQQDGETNEAYKARLNSYKTRDGENNTAYLKRRLAEQYESQKKAYNAAITKDIKDKQKRLKEEIGTAQTTLDQTKTALGIANAEINEYKQILKPTSEQRTKYINAITKRSKAAAAIKRQELLIAQKNKKLLEAQAEENRLMNTKSLNAKRGSMERRRVRLEESKQNLAAAGRHIISPGASAYYGAKTGALIGTTIGKQAFKYGTFGKSTRIDKIDSNSGTGIRKSFNRFRNLGLGTTKKSDITKTNTKTINQSTKLLQNEVQNKKTIKSMQNTNKLAKLKETLMKKQKDLEEQIQKLEKLKTTDSSIQKKLKIDNVISQLIEKQRKYAKALLRVQKRLPAENYSTSTDGSSPRAAITEPSTRERPTLRAVAEKSSTDPLPAAAGS
jgi:hypothetical protein